MSVATLILDGLAPAIREELGGESAQLDLFPQLQALPLHQRIVLRALINAVNKEPGFTEPRIEPAAVLGAIDTGIYPDPWSSVFRAPGRMRKLQDHFADLEALPTFDTATHLSIAHWLSRFERQGDAAIDLARNPLCHPWGVTRQQLMATRPTAPVMSLSSQDRRLGPLRAEVFAALLCPVSTTTLPSKTETEALGLVRYVLDGRTQDAYIETRLANGTWVRSRGAWQLDRPLFTWDWLDLLLANHPELMRDPPGKPTTNAQRLALKGRLRHEVMASGLLPFVRSRITSALPLDKEVKRLTEAIVPRVGYSFPTSEDYASVWKSQALWSRLVDENLGLAMLLRLVQPGGEWEFPPNAGGCRLVQDFFGDLGVNKDGWRVLVTHGRALIERGLRFKDADQALRVIALQARLLCNFRGELPQPELIDTLLASLHLVPRMDDLDIPHRLLKVADAACIAARNEGRLEEFLDEEWLSVIAWLVEAAPMIHRNQCAQGWGCILRAKSRWALQELARHSRPEWTAYPTPLAFPNFEVLELDSKAKLAVEGVEMAHCVASYADNCAEGRTRIFSVRRTSDGRRVATVACSHEGSEWSVEEVQGRANSDPGAEVEALGLEIAMACSMGPALPA